MNMEFTHREAPLTSNAGAESGGLNASDVLAQLTLDSSKQSGRSSVSEPLKGGLDHIRRL